MSWRQVRGFNAGRMGKTAGMCLSNVEDGFGISKSERKFPSAKADMDSQLLHPMAELPMNVAVPIYCDTPSPYEHVIVSDHGVIYSDGIKTDLNKFKCFGWGESCGGVRVVEWIDEPSHLSNEEIADEVIAGKWGNGQERKDRLTKAGYNYADIQYIVNQKLAPQFKVGDVVKPTTLVDYYGKALVSYHETYVISSIAGDRAVLSYNDSVWSAMNTKNIRKA